MFLLLVQNLSLLLYSWYYPIVLPVILALHKRSVMPKIGSQFTIINSPLFFQVKLAYPFHKVLVLTRSLDGFFLLKKKKVLKGVFQSERVKTLHMQIFQ